MAAAAALSATGAPQIAAEFPRKCAFLLERKARFKVLYGGRGGAKSWAIARALLIRAMRQPGLRVLCTREVQSSLKESSKQLLEDQIKLLGLSASFRILDDEIRGPGGGWFRFKGLSDPEALKSAEGVDICWIEEARPVVKTSWQKLTPTVRRPGSEIWVSFNPELETDWIWELFVKGDPPANALVQKMSYRDNWWLSDELKAEMEDTKARNYDDYLWIWEGHCRTSLDGAVFADELRALAKEERILRVPYLPGKPVFTFWDLGFADHTSIWFVQPIGFQYHFIDYYENNRKLTDHYIQIIQNRGYVYGAHWLPEDARANHPGVERTVERQCRDAGLPVKIVPKLRIPDQVNAARTIFPVSIFDQERCSAGLARLRGWRYGLNEVKGRWTREPIHDESSHAGSAMCSAGVALKGEPEPKKAKGKRPPPKPDRLAWMGV